MKPLFLRILEAHGVEGKALFEAGHRIDPALERYRAAIDTAMKRAPSMVNEPNVQDWLARLDALAGTDRLSELGGFERWMMLAFGRDTEKDARSGGVPIDLRLHRRLDELHLAQKQYGHAVRQLRLAWRAAPRDIFALRPLAEASMKNLLENADRDDASTRDEIEALLGAIRELDDRADTAPEAAGLRAKYYRRVLRDPNRALDVYKNALEVNPDSYYLADLVAQTELELNQHDAARTDFERALEIIERLGENNVWSHATATTACVGLGRLDDARDQITRLRHTQPPSESEIDSIARGIQEVADRVGVAADQVNTLLLTLDPRRGRIAPEANASV